MIQPPEIATLTDFTRNVSEALGRLKETVQPQVLTVAGRAQAFVLDVAPFERLLELAERADAIRGIREGLESARWREGRPAAEVYEEFRRSAGSRRMRDAQVSFVR